MNFNIHKREKTKTVERTKMDQREFKVQMDLWDQELNCAFTLKGVI